MTLWFHEFWHSLMGFLYKWRSALLFLTAISASFASISWLVSSEIDIPKIDQTVIGLTENPADKFNAAMSRVSLWNSRAAAAACISAFCQALYHFVRFRSNDRKHPVSSEVD